MNRECNSRLHVEDPGAPEPPFSNPAWHPGYRPNWINRIHMPEKEHWLVFRGIGAVEVDLQMIAEVLCKMHMNSPAEFREARSDNCPKPIHRLLYITRRFDLNQLANGFNDLRLLLLKIPELLARTGEGHSLFAVLTRLPEGAIKYNLQSRRNMTDAPQTLTEAPAAEQSKLDIHDILRILPHRYPFLLIDRVIDLVRMQRIVAIKNVTINEPFFAGHFPNMPIMPGVLIVEAVAQAGGALLLTEIPDREHKLMVFTGIEKARFRRPVVPGDQLRIEVDVKAWRGDAVRMQGNAYVEDKKVAEAIVTCRLVDRDRGRGSQTESDDNPPA